MLSAPLAKAQGILGIGSSGISGLPTTAQFGDTLNNLGLYLVNRGNIPVGSLFVNLVSQTNQSGSPFTIGTLDLTGGILQPGDSTYVPLDAFVVTPQNSNSGSNVMVIWPTAPGTQPGDSATGEYEVDGPTAISSSVIEDEEIAIWPNPSNGQFQLLTTNSSLKACSLVIYDQTGRIILQSKFESGLSIQLPQRKAGIYFLALEHKNGTLYKRKLIVQ